MATAMTDDPLDAMKARWNHIQGYLFPWLREEVDPITEALGRLVTTLDVIGLEAFVPEPPRGAGRPQSSASMSTGRCVAFSVGNDARKCRRKLPFPVPLRSLRRAICPTRCTRR